jgi:hypothetical protein
MGSSLPVRTQRGLLSSAARTATATSPQQPETVCSSATFYLNVTAASGTGGLTLNILGYDKESGNAVAHFTAAAAVTATGMYVYQMIYNNVAAASNGITAAVSRPLPVLWAAEVVHGDGSSYTYSLSADVFP